MSENKYEPERCASCGRTVIDGMGIVVAEYSELIGLDGGHRCKGCFLAGKVLDSWTGRSFKWTGSKYPVDTDLSNDDDDDGLATDSLAVDPLTDIAARINEFHRSAVKHAKSALEHARQAGELLAQAKEQIGHGGWLEWLAANCEVSPRQAQRYMKVAANWDAITKNDAASHLTIDSAIASVGTAEQELSPIGDKATDIDQQLTEWIRRIESLPKGKALACLYPLGMSVIFHSGEYPGYFHHYSYLFGTGDAGEAQETRKPANAFGTAYSLRMEKANLDDFFEVDGSDWRDLHLPSGQGYLPYSKHFTEMMRGVPA